MLWTPGNDFLWRVDNFGATYTDAGFGTTATSGGANTKGTAVSLIAGASVTQDVYGMAICFTGGNQSANIRQFLADILVDVAGGTTWTVLIPNLMVNSPALNLGGYWYYFPIYIKNGTSIGFQHQCGVTTIAMRCGVRLYGNPSRPELVKCGTVIEAFGPLTASSTGTAITPGTSAQGSYTASMGTTVQDLWWWQGGLSIGDTTMTALQYFCDVAVDATTKLTCASDIVVLNSAAEAAGKSPFGSTMPYRFVKAGNTVYMRAACVGTPDSSITAAAYGLGG